jgi:hypothetical protein
MHYYSLCLHRRNLTRIYKLNRSKRRRFQRLESALNNWLNGYLKCRVALDGEGTYWNGEYYESQIGIEEALWNLGRVYSGAIVTLPKHSSADKLIQHKKWCSEITQVPYIENAVKLKPTNARAAPRKKDAEMCANACVRIQGLTASMPSTQRALLIAAMQRAIENFQAAEEVQ